jgi:hypothetical protein
MFRQLRFVTLASLSSLALVAPAAAQNFLPASAETPPAGNLELSAYPTMLFGRHNGPDRLGGAGRLGYGITNSLDIAGKLGVFSGFTLAGLDAELSFLRGPIDMSAAVGAHKALVHDADNSTALDLTWLATAPITRDLALSGGATVSFESLDNVPHSGFTRVYLGPGLRYRLSSRLDLRAQAGIGVNHDSPSYVTVGIAARLPVSESARRRD